MERNLSSDEPQSDSHQTENKPEKVGSKTAQRSRPNFIVPIIVLTLAVLLFLFIQGYWNKWEGGKAEQRTDDAYIHADLTPLSTRVSGTVRKVNVNDYQPVQAGQLLVQLEDDDYGAELQEAKAALAGSQAQLANNQAEKRIQDAKIASSEADIAKALANVDSARAAIASAKAAALQAEAERKRQEALFADKATTHQHLEQVEAQADEAEDKVADNQAKLQQAQASLASSRTSREGERLQRAELDTKDRMYEADIQDKKAGIVVAGVNLGYTRITAPTAGSVGQRHVYEGQLVGTGMEVIELVRGDVWVEANYRETQLTHVTKGDTADITVDAFPGIILHGKVAEIAPASGSQTALLPPDNATGNFTKVVQRIPVKIVLDPDHPLQGKLRPGFSVEVAIHALDSNARAEGPRS